MKLYILNYSQYPSDINRQWQSIIHSDERNLLWPIRLAINNNSEKHYKRIFSSGDVPVDLMLVRFSNQPEV